jgi:hypothetical protein
MYGETYGEFATGRWLCACMYGLPYGGTDGYAIFKLCTDTMGDAYGIDRVGIAPGSYCMFKPVGAGDETRDGGGSEGSAGIM